MALRDGNPFYFLFSPADQARLDAGAITVEDVACAAAPAAGAPYPQSARIRVRLAVAGPAPRVRPLGPGLLTFAAAAPGGTRMVLPVADEVVFANYGTWRTRGTVRLDVRDAKVVARLRALTGLPVVPNVCWYGPVDLTASFLEAGLPALRAPKPLAGRRPVPDAPSSLKWVQRVVSGFLRGTHAAEITSAAQAAADSQVTVEMPSLVPIADGSLEYELIVSCAYDRAPFDGTYADYQVTGAVAPSDPAHPRHGAVPARLVYARLRAPVEGAPLIDGAPGAPIADALRTPTPEGRDYHPLRFTRVWQPVEDVSVHFPSQVVQVRPVIGGGPLQIDQRLPSHGVLWLSLTAIEALAGASVSIVSPAGEPTREMWWLSGDTIDNWLDPAGTTPLALQSVPASVQDPRSHVVLRRRLGQEVIYDRKHRPTGTGCSYFSLRRLTRALVNHRIAGGRLNFEVYVVNNQIQGANTGTTRTIVKDALRTTSSGFQVGHVVFDGRPDHHGTPGDEAPKVIAVFDQFFPWIVDSQPGAGADATYTLGKAGYYVWQSAIDEFEDLPTRRNFVDVWRGGGSAGALVAFGLADGYAVHPDTVARGAAESDASYRSRIVEAMLTPGRLQPGAVLQFWDHFRDYTDLRNRTVGSRRPLPGHSPIFLAPSGPAGGPTGMIVLDQNAQQMPCPRTGDAGAYILAWDSYTPDLWIAANWNE